MKTLDELRKEFEETGLFKNELKMHKPYFRIGHYFIDGNDSADKFLCGAWEMFQELNNELN